MRLNKECDRDLLLVIREIVNLDDEFFEWDGIDRDNPANSTISLCEMLSRLQDFKQCKGKKEVLDFESLKAAEKKFYRTLSGQETHILLGSLRARISNGSFLLNPCNGSSGKEEYKLADFFALAADSVLFGAVIKAAYLILCLGVTATTADSIQAMVLQDETYPPLQLFVNFFQETHILPVRTSMELIFSRLIYVVSLL